MAEPQPAPAALAESIRPSLDRLASLLRGVRLASDASSVMAAAVAALGGLLTARPAAAWIAADPDGDGRLEVVAVSGGGAGAIAEVAGAVAAGDVPWRDACAAAGLVLTAWEPLGAASLPSAFLGLAASAGPPDPTTDLSPDPATGEIARFIGLMVDVHADRAAVEGLLATTGRLDWLEATRRASRTVRHDLANVLTGIAFYGSQTAADLPPGTASAADALAIGDAVARGGRLLDLLLELWREPAETEVVPLDPAAVVDSIARVLAMVAAPRDLEVGQLTSTVVRASRRMLEEALLALVVEARETADGRVAPITIAVAAEVLPSDNALGLAGGAYAAIAIGDAAPTPSDGIVRSAHDPLTPGPAELGEGLATVLASTRPGERGRAVALAALAARAAGGGLRLEGWPGQGSRATILLPQASSRRRGVPAADETFADG